MIQNRTDFDEVVAMNQMTSALLLFREAIVTAVADKRLNRGHLRVLTAISMFIDKTTEAWPKRETISLVLGGMSLKTVSNLITELRNYGYLITTRKSVEKAEGKILTVYTFGNINHEAVRKMHSTFITEYVHQHRNVQIPEIATAVAPQSKVGGKVPAPAGTAGNEFPSQRELPVTSSRPSGNSGELDLPLEHSGKPNEINDVGDRKTRARADTESLKSFKQEKEKEREVRTSKRGSRLPATWTLPVDWKAWALEQFKVTDKIVNREHEKFRDYWIGAPGTKGVKADWQATWRNWCRRAFEKLMRDAPLLDAIGKGKKDDLTEMAERTNKLYEQEQEELRRKEEQKRLDRLTWKAQPC